LSKTTRRARPSQPRVPQPRLNVLCAVDGEEGLDLIRRHHPAVVLLDLVLPKISGEAVCLALRADPTLAECTSS